MRPAWSLSRQSDTKSFCALSSCLNARKDSSTAALSDSDLGDTRLDQTYPCMHGSKVW